MNGVASQNGCKPSEVGYQSSESVCMSSLSPDADRETSYDRACLVEERKRVSIRTAVRLRVLVFVVSWLSVITLGILGVVTFILAQLGQSSATFAFALDALLDCFSSIVVIWRFSGTAGNLYSIKRESIAGICLGVLFQISTVCIIVKSCIALVGDLHSHNETFWYLFLITGLLCLFLVIAKVYLGFKLESTTLISDAINSALGAILAFTTLITGVIHDEGDQYWKVDPIMGLVCAILLCVYGIWIIIHSSRNLNKSNKTVLQNEVKA